MKSSTLSLDFPWKVVPVGCLTERENDIFGEAESERSGRGRGSNKDSGSIEGGSSRGRGLGGDDESDERYPGDECRDVGGDTCRTVADPADLLVLDNVSSTGDEISFRVRPMRRAIDFCDSTFSCAPEESC